MIELTNHFEKRFKQRIARTKRMQQYAENAFYFGKSLHEVKNKSFAKQLVKKEQYNGSTAKIYSNCIYWFINNTAVTVYPIPQKMHKMI